MMVKAMQLSHKNVKHKEKSIFMLMQVTPF